MRQLTPRVAALACAMLALTLTTALWALMPWRGAGSGALVELSATTSLRTTDNHHAQRDDSDDEQGSADGPDPYDEATAVYLAHVTSVAYCGAANILDWSCLPCSLLPPLEHVSVVEDRKDDFQGVVGYNRDRNAVIVAFRGSIDLKNWIDNLTFLKRRAYPHFPEVKVHEGFFAAFMSVADDVVTAIQDLRRKFPRASIVIAGHSLGGAVAALCAFDLTMLRHIPISALYTFGEPRVGNENFSALLNGAIADIFRVTHNRDMVPHLPPRWLGFTHVTQEIFYDEFFEQYVTCSGIDGEDPFCSDQCAPFGCTSAVDHLTYLNVTMGHLMC